LGGVGIIKDSPIGVQFRKGLEKEGGKSSDEMETTSQKVRDQIRLENEKK